ncbi:RNA-directed DNA polymerase, eukaryota, reverse transcriptase zinc-binding domain protein, partial [Tanacetum coccineum]
MECISTSSFSLNVNGELRDFFNGKRGLRQGDPLSLYLFTLVMEVLNLMIKRNVSLNPRFKYHWQCKDLKLTHLCFADDLMLFCHGNSKFVSILKNSLDEFGRVSSLFPSFPKSTVFFRNVKESMKKRLLDWKNKSLSFAGRLQLIMLVVKSMQHAICPLGDFISKRKIMYTGLSLDCKLANVIEDGDWKWPGVLSNEFDGLNFIEPPILIEGKNDKVFQCIHRYAFMVWLAIRGRLKTQDSMGVWEKNDDMRSVDALLDLIIDTVRLRVMSLTVNDSTLVYEATSLWNFHVDR